ncbi:MAG: TonB family protein [Ectothiorhodospiraceae bacterium]|nr:TonB family protein [Ectothiorhodospiraceae bacterium]
MPASPADRLTVALFLAMVLHALVILGVSFSPRDAARTRTSALDVILVQRAAEREPEDARYLAQANQDGGGEADEPSRPATPLPAPFVGEQPEIASAAPPVTPSEPLDVPPPPTPAAKAAAPEPTPPSATRPVIAQAVRPSPHRVARPDPPRELRQTPSQRAKPATVVAKARPPAPAPATPPQPAQTLDAATLVSRSLAMASLSAELDQRLKAYAERPRRKWITARTRQHKYAAYMDAWRQKVERIGNLNYPDDARRDRLSGSLLLDVALNADGSINQITLRRSSGERVLDDAAERIVRLAAPFAEFPKAIAEEVDILHIERTWQFLSTNRFASR